MARPIASNASVSVLLLGIGVVLFLSPFTGWWLEQDFPWYSTYLLWFGYILAIAVTIGRRSRHEL